MLRMSEYVSRATYSSAIDLVFSHAPKSWMAIVMRRISSRQMSVLCEDQSPCCNREANGRLPLLTILYHIQLVLGS
jgi:hypothetical protein